MSTPTVHDAKDFGERVAVELLELVRHLSTQKEASDEFMRAARIVYSQYSDEDRTEAAAIGFYVVLMDCAHLPVDYIKPISDKSFMVLTASEVSQ